MPPRSTTPQPARLRIRAASARAALVATGRRSPSASVTGVLPEAPGIWSVHGSLDADTLTQWLAESGGVGQGQRTGDLLWYAFDGCDLKGEPGV